MRLLLRPILGQYDASWRPNDRVSHECHSAHCVVHQWCRLSDGVGLWKTRRTVLLHCSQSSRKFQHGVYASGQAMAQFGNTRQATSEGKSGPVETRLTELAATALYYKYVQIM